MNVTAIYFSPTGGTKKNTSSIATALRSDGNHSVIDIAKYENAKLIEQFGENDFVVFGFPCYSGRVPEVAVERAKGINGNNTPCIITITYGNRDYDDSLLELSDLVSSKGFIVQAAAALVAQHTFGEIQVGRPDASDEAENRKFVEQLLAARRGRFSTAITLPIKGNHPYQGEGKGAGFTPLTFDSCVQCGKCTEECPVHAVGTDNCTIDTEKCLSCFRCIRICPVGAKNMDTDQYIEFAREFTIQLSARRENEYYF